MKSTRAMVLSLVALAAVCISLAACAGPGPAYRDMVSASDAAANVTIGPKFERYLAADASLSDEDRRDWTDLLAAWRSAVAAAKQEVGQP